jgi:deazaflavin-dependent oxidoreductase (nitroreductase family)
MRLPESLFVIINPTVRLLLQSPLHRLMSKSLMLITFTGRNSGQSYTTPVRYMRYQGAICCFSTAGNKWWRNLRGGAEVTLRVEGKTSQYHAIAIESQPAQIRAALLQLFSKFPQDAPYYDVKINRDGAPKPEDLDLAAQNTVMVQAREKG